MIKITVKRAEIREDFKELLTEVVREEADTMRAYCEHYPYQKERYLKMNAPRLRFATTVLNNWDKIATGLRMLSGFTVFDAFRYQNVTYFHAHTKSVTISDGGSHNIGTQRKKELVDNEPCWDLGEYDVYIPRDIFKNKNLNHFHFIPILAPLDGRRHPHHHAKYTDGTQDNETGLFLRGGEYLDARATHGLDLTARTCWGGFNSIIASNLSEMDAVEVFRTVWIYLNRYNAGSPLVHFEDITFKRPINENRN